MAAHPTLNINNDRLCLLQISTESGDCHLVKFHKGKLTGIKGQYLIFEDASVFNVRSNEGYVVEIGLK